MLKEGLSVEQAARITGLPAEEIGKLQPPFRKKAKVFSENSRKS
jgi:hypothetical protein